jgi:aminoglycoside phosphotransferase (APT) family kinase protein
VDLPELERFLAGELAVDVAEATVLADGLNLVVGVSTPDRDPAYVLRSPRKLRESALFLDLRTEYATLERLADTSLPTPEPVAFFEDGPLDGPFYLATHLPGEPLPWSTALPERLRNPAARDRIATHTVETLAAVHAVDTDPFEGVLPAVSPREQVEATAARLDPVTDATGLELPGLRAVADRLRERAPDGGERTLVHGDFRPGNLLFDGDCPVTGVLDWETAALGDPLTELGYLLLDWREGTEWPDPAALGHPPEAEGMDRARELHRDGLTPFTTRAGSPSAAELAARYESHTGRAFEHGGFHRALAAFGLAVVWADLNRHAVVAGERDPTDALPAVEYVGLVAARALGE